MTLREGVGRARVAAAWVGASRGRVALAWAGATFLALALLAGGAGISRDEAAVLERGDRALRAGGAPASIARPVPPLASGLAAATHAVAAPLRVGHVRAARLGSALLGAVLSAVLVLLGWDLVGRTAALLAPALFWAAPRHLHAGLVATPDLALAAFWAATVLAYRRAGSEPDPRRRRQAVLVSGLAFGAALATRPDAWILLPALALHAALARAPRIETETHQGGKPGRGGARRALLAMTLLGPVVLIALWPSLWPSPLRTLALAFAPARTASWGHAAVVTALAVPAALLLAYAGGFAHALVRVSRGLRGRAAVAETSDDALLLLCAAAPFAAATLGIAPATGGVRPWLHAMPILALLGTRVLLAAARVAWPQRSAPLAASLALLVLWPSVRAAGHHHPTATSAWNEIAGGAPGAAALGLQRQDGGDAAATVLAQLNARARDGARVFWPTIAPAAVRAFARDGRLRPDLAVADAPEDADLAVVTVEGTGSRDAEYRTWAAFRTARPAAGVYLDEVPLVLVYARPGAWR